MENISAGSKCRETALSFMGIVPRLKRSMKDVPRSKSTARLETTLVRGRVCWLSIQV